MTKNVDERADHVLGRIACAHLKTNLEECKSLLCYYETLVKSYLDCSMLAEFRHISRSQNVPRSKGCVTQAAMLLALPPNQKGYLIVVFFASAVAFPVLTGAVSVVLLIAS